MVWSHDANHEQICCTILVTRHFSDRQDSFKFTMDASFFEDFSFNSLLYCFTLVYMTTRNFPCISKLALTPSLFLGKENLFFFINYNCSNSDIVVSICWQSVFHGFIHPFAHKDIPIFLMGMMEIESMLKCHVYQMTFWWLEENLNRPRTILLPMIKTAC